MPLFEVEQTLALAGEEFRASPSLASFCRSSDVLGGVGPLSLASCSDGASVAQLRMVLVVAVLSALRSLHDSFRRG